MPQKGTELGGRRWPRNLIHRSDPSVRVPMCAVDPVQLQCISREGTASR
jgi:hypothetical protein